MFNFKIVYEIDGKIIEASSLVTNDYKISLCEENNRFKYSICSKRKLYIKKFFVKIPYKYSKKSLIYLNGYQSWTDSKEFYIKERIKDVRKIPEKIRNKYSFDRYGDSCFKDYKKDILHGYTYSYVRDKSSLFIGSFNEDNAYLIINHDYKKNIIILESDLGLEINDTFCMMDFYYGLDVDKSMNEYFSSFGIIKSKSLRGYTSWYNHYQNINQKLIIDAIDHNDVFDLFQIDDGYETYVGDWLDIDKIKFPSGLEDIVSKIHSKNMIAGIWLAPFVAEEKSILFKNHFDWFAKDKSGNAIKAGSNWSGFYVLDFDKIEVRNYIKTSLQKYVDLGFDFFKLDFLYAIGLSKSNDKTRAMKQVEAMNFIRDILKDKIILACGAPLSSCFGRVDYCRVGPDVSLIFDDVWYMKHMHRERISTKVTLQNTLYRSHMSGYVFKNDPDVVVLRKENNKLSLKQRKALLTINILFGDLFMTSDDYSMYSEENLSEIDYLFELKEKIRKKEIKRVKYYIYVKLILEDDKSLYFKYNTRSGELKWISQK